MTYEQAVLMILNADPTGMHLDKIQSYFDPGERYKVKKAVLEMLHENVLDVTLNGKYKRK